MNGANFENRHPINFYISNSFVITPDATLTKFYKCHPTTQVGAVVCILC